MVNYTRSEPFKKEKPMAGMPLDAVMNSLRAKLSGILASFDRNTRVMYLDYPVLRNVGDLLINVGTEQFFKENDVHVWRRYSIADFPKDLPHIDSDVTVICQGGGNFGDIWTEYQNFREAIFEKYASNRVVVMPQSVHFKSAEAARASLGKIAKHRNYHIYARDQKSVDTLQAAGMTSVSAMPDMAHALWGVLPTPRPEGHRAFFLKRTDVESTPLPEEYAQECASLESYDWLTILSPLPRMLAYLAGGIMRRESRYSHLTFQKHRQWYPIRDMVVRSSLKFFSSYSTIYTNRLHGMLLGALLKKEVFAFDNSYGKLSGYHRAWLSECRDIRLICN
jgi:pyruvyl transferase EpsO